MKALAIKQPSHDFHKSHREVIQAPLIQNVIPATGVLQRKSACPCGGGCPLCEGNMVIQPKLRIGKSGDRYEREADRVADEVMRMSELQVQRTPDEEEEQIQTTQLAKQITPLVQRQVEEETILVNLVNERRVQRQERDLDGKEEEYIQSEQLPVSTPKLLDLPARINSLRIGGQPLSETTRSFFESRLRYDFSQVHIHSDGEAAELARDVKARAFTIGHDIVFGEAQYAPSTVSGRKLLGHELVHVVQQNDGDTPSLQREISPATPSWLQRLNDRNLIRNVGSTNYRNWIITLQNVLTEWLLEQVVDQVCSDPYAQALIQTQGLRGLVALYDAVGNVEIAQRLLRRWRDYTREGVRRQRRRTINFPHPNSEEEHHEQIREIVRIVDRPREGTWDRIVAMRRQSPENHEAVVLALLRALQLVLRHQSGREETGRPIQAYPDFIGSNCSYTSWIIVRGLRALGIPARVRVTTEFVPDRPGYRHNFPWFTSLQRGFFHGDDLYNEPIRDPAVLLRDETAIGEHWRFLFEFEQQSQEVGSMLLWGEMGRPATASQETDRTQIISQLGAAVNELIEVPSSSGSAPFRVSIRDVLTAAPAQLVLAFSNVYRSHILSALNSIQRFLIGLPTMVEGRLQFGDYFPVDLRQPRLPETRDEAIQEIIKAIFRYTVDYSARVEANALISSPEARRMAESDRRVIESITSTINPPNQEK